MTSRRFVSLAAACAIGTMALAVPTLPVQAAPTSASTIVAVASVAPQTDAVSASAAPASSHKTGTRPGHQSARSALDERHSHSMVAGGLEVTSRTTRLTSGTEFVMRVEMRARTS